MADGYVSVVVEKLERMRALNSSMASIRVLRQLQALFLEDNLEMVRRSQKTINWIRDVMIVTQEMRDTIDYMLIHKWTCSFISILKDLTTHRKFRKEMKRICETKPSPIDVELVGFHGYIQRLEEWLMKEIDSPPPTNICLISGSTGSGKTSLLLEVYYSDSVKSHFSSRVWIPTPPSPSSVDDSVYHDLILKSLVRTVLTECVAGGRVEKDDDELEVEDDRARFGVQKVLDVDQVEFMSKSEMGEVLSEGLQGKRYLIVLDGNIDLSSIPNFFEMLKNLGILDIGRDGSRIVVSSQKIPEPNNPIDQSLNWSDYCDNVIPLQPLNREDSWKLLVKNLEEGSTINLDVQNEIVRRCGGLPSEIVNLGSLLSTVKHERPLTQLHISSILDVCKNDYMIDRVPRIASMASEYLRLRRFSKFCFLYCGMFPEGFDIPVRRLSHLLEAETWFVPDMEFSRQLLSRDEMESFEDTTNKHLLNLEALGMIEVQWKATGTMLKTCQLKRIAENFCIMKATQINFFYEIGYRRERYHLPKITASKLTLNGEYDSVQSDEMKSFPRLNSLLCFAKIDRDGWRLLFDTLRSYKLLQVLDLEGMESLNKLPEWIGELILLRYLGLRRTGLVSLPASLANLTNLWTLDLRGTHINSMPKCILELRQLRHLYMEMDTRVSGNSPDLSFFIEFRTLSMIRAGGWMQYNLINMKDLRKLGIYGDLDLCENVIFRPQPNMKKLESLKLGMGFGGMVSKSMISTLGFPHLSSLYLERPLDGLPDFPPAISKLCLKWSQLEEDPMPILKQLRNLRVLKLRCGSYLGKEMVCSPGGFEKLQVLELDLLDALEEWRVENPAMAKLRCLVIRLCKRLRMLPQGLQHLGELQLVQISGMPMVFNARLQDSMGEDWIKIRHVRSITINGIQMAAASSSSASST